MFSQILKWVEKVGEKEFHLFLDHDTSLDALKEFAYRLLKHAVVVEEQQKALKAQQEAEEEKKKQQEKPVEVPEQPEQE